MKIRQKALLYREMEKLVGAGLQLRPSIELLLEQSPAEAVADYLNGLRRGLDEHLNVADSIARHNEKLVSSLEIRLVDAGERGGRLAEAFGFLADYFEMQEQARRKAMGALIYPLVLLHVALLFPDIPKMMTGTATVGSVLGDGLFRIIVAWAIIGGLTVAWMELVKTAKTNSGADALLRRVPLIGSLRLHWALARFCRVMETSLTAALRISEALRLAGASTQSAQLAAAAERCAQNVEQGRTLAQAFRAAGGFPRTMVNAFETAEQAGTLDLEMRRWAQVEIQQAATSQDRLAEWLPKLFYGLVMIYAVYRILGAASGIYGPDGFYQSVLKG